MMNKKLMLITSAMMAVLLLNNAVLGAGRSNISFSVDLPKIQINETVELDNGRYIFEVIKPDTSCFLAVYSLKDQIKYGVNAEPIVNNIQAACLSLERMQEESSIEIVQTSVNSGVSLLYFEIPDHSIDKLRVIIMPFFKLHRF